MGDKARGIRGAAMALAAGAAVIAWTTHAATGTGALLIGLCALPALILLAPRRRRAAQFGGLLIVMGLVVTGAGVVVTKHDRGLDLLRYDFTPRQIAVAAADHLAGLGWVAGGVLMIVAGVAVLTSSTLLRRLATAGTMLLGCGFALALAVSAYRSMHYMGGTVRTASFLAAVLVALGVVLLPVALWVRPREPRGPGEPRVPDEPPVPGEARSADETSRPGAARRRPMVVAVVLAGLAAVVGGGVFAGVRVAHPGLLVADLFPDQSLAACVATSLTHEQTTDSRPVRVSRRELNSVFHLRCTAGAFGPVKRLDGLANLPSLSTLDVSNQAVSDLSPLTTAPNLRVLRATNNQIHDLNPLRQLTGLTSLGLSGNQISSLEPLSGLSGLTALGLDRNQITDASPLAGLTALTDLDLGHNQITDASSVSGLVQLDNLDLAANRISNVTPACTPPGITELNVAKNQIADVAPLAGCMKVRQLWLGQNPVQDVTPLAQMPSLLGVDLTSVDTFRLPGIDVLTQKGIYIGGGAKPHEE